MMQIRKIKPEDISFVLDLVSENGYPLGKLLSNIESFIVCENDGAKCGCGCIVVSEERGYLNWVIVREDCRRNKLGTALVKALLNIADLKGAKETYCPDTCTDFMKTLGFEECENTTAIEDMERYFGGISTSGCCSVSLAGYFKQCSGK